MCDRVPVDRKLRENFRGICSWALLRISACQKTVGCFAPPPRCCQQQHVCLFTASCYRSSL
jgi:hypothetical protein